MRTSVIDFEEGEQMAKILSVIALVGTVSPAQPCGR